tara:strand:+ start:32 stop:232 length:201 start_codon:yes stop_codon:yes gene_type:complete
MAESSSNDTIFDQFLYIINVAIENGDPNILREAIKNYQNLISDTYIKIAKDMYFQLITEKVEDLNI